MSRDEKRPEGGGNLQRANDEATPGESITTSVQRAMPWFDRERTQRRTRLRDAIDRAEASHQLDALLGTIEQRPRVDGSPTRHSDRWERAWANDLVRTWGFDPEYVAHRYGLTRRTGASV